MGEHCLYVPWFCYYQLHKVSSLTLTLFNYYSVPNFVFQDDDGHDGDGCQTWMICQKVDFINLH